MIFVGDISLPSSITLSSFPQNILRKLWFGNLEGSLINDEGSLNLDNKVYNSFETWNTLCNILNFKAVCLANNHILDVQPINESVRNIERLNLKYVGAGSNIDSACKSLLLDDYDSSKYEILAFGWDCIDCIYADSRKEGVNPLIREHIISEVKKAIQHKTKVICFFHWNYELELYPQPYDRALAFELIDLGVAAVMGCHAHRVQQIEFYKGKPIVYGLGNFLFKQNYYFGGQLKYPDFSNEEWAFEISGDDYYLHRFEYSRERNECVFKDSTLISDTSDFYARAEYSGMSLDDYYVFFKQNRVQKKMLPIFSHTDIRFFLRIKSKWVFLRGCLISLLVRMKLKGNERR